MKLANDDEGPLHVNRRGIVPPRADSDKPVFTASELIEQRHLGLSFKQIGRKLGIDPHKGDVLQVSLEFKLSSDFQGVLFLLFNNYGVPLRFFPLEVCCYVFVPHAMPMVDCAGL